MVTNPFKPASSASEDPPAAGRRGDSDYRRKVLKGPSRPQGAVCQGCQPCYEGDRRKFNRCRAV